MLKLEAHDTALMDEARRAAFIIATVVFATFPNRLAGQDSRPDSAPASRSGSSVS